MTAVPSSSEAARSTGAEMPQAWSPAGSAKIWRTDQVVLPSSMISIAGPRASGPVPISSCASQYPSRASSQAAAFQPSAASSSPSSSYFPRAARVTRRNSAFRTSTRKARMLLVSVFGCAFSSADAGGGVGRLPLLADRGGVAGADDLAEPLDQVGQLLGLGLVRDGLPQRLVGVGE